MARLETALLMAWRTAAPPSRSAPLADEFAAARRWNQRVYRAVWPRYPAQYGPSHRGTVIVASPKATSSAPAARRACVSRECEAAERRLLPPADDFKPE